MFLLRGGKKVVQNIFSTSKSNMRFSVSSDVAVVSQQTSITSPPTLHTPVIVRGNRIARQLLEEIKRDVDQVFNLHPQIRRPKLAIILVGDAADSISYVSKKQQACAKVGVVSELIHLPEATSQAEVLEIIQELNSREDVDSILTQVGCLGCTNYGITSNTLPINPPLYQLHPQTDSTESQIKKSEVISAIDPKKDVDGLQKCFQTMQLVWDYSNNRAIPCTPNSCLHILGVHGVEVARKNIVMLGKGLLVGTPLTALLLSRGAYVRMCDKRNDIIEALLDADIVISATGHRGLVQGGHLKQGAVVIDVGCSRPLPHEDQTSVVGDVDFSSAIFKASLITPVPGGVGPVTVSVLIKNVVKQWKDSHSIDAIEKSIKH